MKLTDYRLLADENIQPKAISFLRDNGLDVLSVDEADLMGAADLSILDYAVNNNRIIITQDSDFGTAMYRLGVRNTGIVFLRPGHVNSLQVISMLGALLLTNDFPDIPFVAVVELLPTRIKLRIRKLNLAT